MQAVNKIIFQYFYTDMHIAANNNNNKLKY